MHGEFDTRETGPMSLADQKAARALMGIPDEARVIPMNLSNVPLFVVVQETEDGLDIQASGTMSKPRAAEVLRIIADAWDHAEQ